MYTVEGIEIEDWYIAFAIGPLHGRSSLRDSALTTYRAGEQKCLASMCQF